MEIQTYFPKITWVFSLPNSHSSRDSGSWKCLSHVMVPCSTGDFLKHCARGLNFITGIWEFLKNSGTRKFRFFFLLWIFNYGYLQLQKQCSIISIVPSNSLLLPIYFLFYLSNVFPLCFQKLQKSWRFFDRHTSIKAFFSTSAKDVIDFHLCSAYHWNSALQMEL